MKKSLFTKKLEQRNEMGETREVITDYHGEVFSVYFGVLDRLFPQKKKLG